MASNIDPTKPAAPPAVGLAADLRQNLSHAKDEIEALQAEDTLLDGRIDTLEAGGSGGVASTAITVCKLRLSGDHSFSASTEDHIDWTTEDTDPYGLIAVTADTLTITSDLNGAQIRVGFNVEFDGTTVTDKLFRAYFTLWPAASNSRPSIDKSSTSTASTPDGGGWSEILDVVTGDTIRLSVWSDAVSPKVVSGTKTWLVVELILPPRIPNLIINPEFEVDQRESYGSSIDDGVFGPDRWGVISDGDDIVTPDQETSSVPAGARSALKLTVGATTNKQFGLVHPIASDVCGHVVGGLASFRVYLRKGSGDTITKVRAAILSWTGAADAMTLDVVSAWAGGGTEPTWATNYTREGTIKDCTLSTTWTSYESLAISIDTASTKQFALVLWIDDTSIATGDDLYVSAVQVNEGTVVGKWEPKSKAGYEHDCLPHAERIDTANASGTYGYFAMGEFTLTTAFQCVIPYRRKKYGSVTLDAAVASQFSAFAGGSGFTGSAIALEANSMAEYSALIGLTVSGATANTPGRLTANNNNTAYLLFLSEIAS